MPGSTKTFTTRNKEGGKNSGDRAGNAALHGCPKTTAVSIFSTSPEVRGVTTRRSICTTGIHTDKN